MQQVSDLFLHFEVDLLGKSDSMNSMLQKLNLQRIPGYSAVD